MEILTLLSGLDNFVIRSSSFDNMFGGTFNLKYKNSKFFILYKYIFCTQWMQGEVHFLVFGEAWSQMRIKFQDILRSDKVFIGSVFT